MMIKTENLSYSYRGVPALEHVSFGVEQGQLTAVLGPNGAGKSTLFRCILGLLKGYEGSVLLDGKEAKTLDRRRLAELAAYIPQTVLPTFNYTVLETVLMGTTGQLGILQTPQQEQIDTAWQMLKLLGIEDLAHRGVAEISGGECQLVLIARALAQNARILIMDEPTANLDYGNQQRVLSRIRALAEQGYTVLLSTHNPEHAMQYATQILALQGGKVCAEGPVGQALTETLIRKLYGINAVISELSLPDGTVKHYIAAAEKTTGL